MGVLVPAQAERRQQARRRVRKPRGSMGVIIIRANRQHV
jgi:hypothetical protein